MKASIFSQFLTVLFTLYSSLAPSLAAKVSYDGAKAIRISTSEDVAPVLDLIQKFDLPIWKGVTNGIPVANGHVDLMVPAEKVEEFEALTSGSDFKIDVMHEDLGASIEAESGGVSAYAGKIPSTL
jgi:hypothetical protein